FLFTDISGTTRILQELSAEDYAEALAEHRPAVRDAFAAHGDVEVDTQGDAFFYAFPTAPGALGAAADATEAPAGGPIRVRMGVPVRKPCAHSSSSATRTTAPFRCATSRTHTGT